MEKMITFLAVFALVLALAPATGAFAADNTYQWAGAASALAETTNTVWTDGLNWSNITTSTYNDGYPDGVGDVAWFYLTANDEPNINIADDITLGSWTNSGGSSYPVGSVAGAGSITFDNGANDSFLTWRGTRNYYGNSTFYNDIIMTGDFHWEWRSQRTKYMNSTITGTGDFYVWISCSDQNSVTIGGSASTASNTYSGNTYITMNENYGGPPKLILDKDGAVNGDVTVTTENEVDSKVVITEDGTEDRIPDTSSLYLNSYSAGTEHTIIELYAGVDETVAGLYFDGAAQLPGIWGGTGSNPIPDYINDNFFTGTGVLRVVIPPPDGAVLIIK